MMRWVPICTENDNRGRIVVSDYMDVPGGRIYRTVASIIQTYNTEGGAGISVVQTFVPN